MGYVAAPGTIAGPRGVAARGSLVAVSAWKMQGRGGHVVRVFEGSGAMWAQVRVVAGGFGGPGWADGQLHWPWGLRFSSDGTGLAVADRNNGRVSLFRVEDGSFVRHVATGLDFPYDVEECEGGWLAACWASHTIEFVSSSSADADANADAAAGAADVATSAVDRARLGSHGSGDGQFVCPLSLALVPGLGLVVREDGKGGWLQVFSTPDVIAMATMSPHRVGWMVAVVRSSVLSGGVLAGQHCVHGLA